MAAFDATSVHGRYKLLRGILWFVCVYHVLLGIALNAPGDWVAWVGANVFGMGRLPDVSTLFVARVLGGYQLVFGIGMGLAAWDPVKNRALLTLGVILVGLRTLQRIVQADYLEQAFEVSPGRNWSMVAMLAAFAVAIALLRLKLLREMREA